MKLLLDTHVLLWCLTDDSSLGVHSRALIIDPAHTVIVSIVSIWEIVLKMRTGKLEADLGEIIRDSASAGFTSIPIAHAHLLELARLPKHHGDPFDHLLIAQAIVEDATLVSNDRHMPFYPVRHMTCSS